MQRSMDCCRTAIKASPYFVRSSPQRPVLALRPWAPALTSLERNTAFYGIGLFFTNDWRGNSNHVSPLCFLSIATALQSNKGGGG